MDLTDYQEPAEPQLYCCVCGLPTESSSSTLCAGCLRTNVDITEGFVKEYGLIYCPECQRYLQPPKYWCHAELDSKELMTLCLKRIRGLAKFNLVDASFIWTEPHSKRIKLRLVLQKELFTNTVIQQNAVIQFEVQWQQCDRCMRAATGQPQWDAVVQLRQKVSHRRTFLFLEQLILKHRMHENATKIEAQREGIDFFFGHRSHAMNFVGFINAHTPAIRRDAHQLVSHDTKSNTAVLHRAISLELSPLCREDVVVLPRKVHSTLGGLGPLVLVHKVYTSIVFLDPKSLRAGEITGSLFWKSPFRSWSTSRDLVEFFVINVEQTGVVNGKFKLVFAEVCLSSEIGTGKVWIIPTHLGSILHPGDFAMGYLLENCNVSCKELDEYKQIELQDVVLVRRSYPTQHKNRNRRIWKLRRLEIEQPEGERIRADSDEEEFCDDLERDPEFRRDVQLFRDRSKEPPAPKPDENEDDDAPAVELAELLDELCVEESPPASDGRKRPRDDSDE